MKSTNQLKNKEYLQYLRTKNMEDQYFVYIHHMTTLFACS